MANVIIPKRSTVAGKAPATGDLQIGEIALNLTDRKLYAKDGSGAIVQIGGGAGSGDVVGPASSTDGAVALFDGTTGKLLKNGSVPGTIYTQNANNVNITGGSISGITDLAIADGGTGSSTAAGARTNLGLGSLATLNTVGTTQIDNAAVTLDKLATAVKPVGAGQSWSTYSRSFNTNYTNSTGRPIAVGVVGQSSAVGFTGIRIFVGGFVVMDQYVYLQANGERLAVFAIVPDNTVYQVQIHTGSMVLSSWAELR